MQRLTQGVAEQQSMAYAQYTARFFRSDPIQVRLSAHDTADRSTYQRVFHTFSLNAWHTSSLCLAAEAPWHLPDAFSR